MIRFEQALRAFGTADFEAVLKRELSQLGTDQLPLQQGLTTGNYVTDAPITVLINRVVEMESVIRVRAGIFYQGVIAGCSCADDPTSAGETNEYCEVQLDIDKTTASVILAA